MSVEAPSTSTERHLKKRLRLAHETILLLAIFIFLLLLFLISYRWAFPPPPNSNKDVFETASYALVGPAGLLLSGYFSWLVYKVTHDLNKLEVERDRRENRVTVILRTNEDNQLQIINMSPAPIYVVGMSYYTSDTPDYRDRLVRHHIRDGHIGTGGTIDVQNEEWEEFFRESLAVPGGKEGVAVRFYHPGYDGKLETVHFVHFEGVRDRMHARFDLEKAQFKPL